MKRKRILPTILTIVVLAGALIFAALASAHWVGKSIISDGSWKIVHCCRPRSDAMSGFAFKHTSGPAGNYRATIMDDSSGQTWCQTGIYNDLNVVHKVSCVHPSFPTGTESVRIVAVADGQTRGYYAYDCNTLDCSDVP